MKPSIPIYCYLTERNENMSIGTVIIECPLQLLHSDFKLEITFSYQELIDKQMVVYPYNRILSNKQASKQTRPMLFQRPSL